MAINQVLLLGRNGADAELKQTTGGTSVINFSLATTERRGDATETHWHRVIVYGKSAERVAPLLKKGVEVFVQGKLWCRNYTDKQGQARNSVEIIAGVVRVAQGIQKEQMPSWDENEMR